MKYFVKALDCEGSGFKYLQEKIPKITEGKVKEHIFVEPQIQEIGNYRIFEAKLTTPKKQCECP